MAKRNPNNWYYNLPCVTQYWFTLAVIIFFLARFQIVSEEKLEWNFQLLKDKFEIWRLITPFCYIGPSHLHPFIVILRFSILYNYSYMYEKFGSFDTGAGGGTADYAFMMLIGSVWSAVSYPILRHFVWVEAIFTINLMFYVMYVWSRRHPDTRTTVLKLPVDASYVPFVHLAISLASGSSWFNAVHGIITGYVYCRIVNVIQTPQFLIDNFGRGVYAARSPGSFAGSGRRF